MILDTSFLIDLIQGDKKAEEKAEELENKFVSEKISSTTVFELYTGIIRSDKPPEEKKKVLNVLNSKEVIEADKNIMERAGKIHGNLINQGERVGSFDCMIAATAISLEEPLLTRNKKDFEKIDLVELESY